MNKLKRGQLNITEALIYSDFSQELKDALALSSGDSAKDFRARALGVYGEARFYDKMLVGGGINANEHITSGSSGVTTAQTIEAQNNIYKIGMSVPQGYTDYPKITATFAYNPGQDPSEFSIMFKFNVPYYVDSDKTEYELFTAKNLNRSDTNFSCLDLNASGNLNLTKTSSDGLTTKTAEIGITSDLTTMVIGFSEGLHTSRLMLTYDDVVFRKQTTASDFTDYTIWHSGNFDPSNISFTTPLKLKLPQSEVYQNSALNISDANDLSIFSIINSMHNALVFNYENTNRQLVFYVGNMSSFSATTKTCMRIDRSGNTIIPRLIIDQQPIGRIDFFSSTFNKNATIYLNGNVFGIENTTTGVYQCLRLDSNGFRHSSDGINFYNVITESILPATPSYTKFLRDDKTFQDIVIGNASSAAWIYFTNINSTLYGAQYKQFSYSPTIASGTITVTSIAANTPVLIGSWLMDAFLYTTAIPQGLWNLNFFRSVSNASGTSFIRAELFLKKYDGSVVVLGSFDGPAINDTTLTAGPSFEKVLPQYACAENDHIGINLYFVSSRTTPTTLTFGFGDGTSSRFSTSLPLRHSQLRQPNEDQNVQHLTWDEKYNGALRTNFVGTVAVVNTLHEVAVVTDNIYAELTEAVNNVNVLGDMVSENSSHIQTNATNITKLTDNVKSLLTHLATTIAKVNELTLKHSDVTQLPVLETDIVDSFVPSTWSLLTGSETNDYVVYISRDFIPSDNNMTIFGQSVSSTAIFDTNANCWAQTQYHTYAKISKTKIGITSSYLSDSLKVALFKVWLMNNLKPL